MSRGFTRCVVRCDHMRKKALGLLGSADPVGFLQCETGLGAITLFAMSTYVSGVDVDPFSPFRCPCASECVLRRYADVTPRNVFSMFISLFLDSELPSPSVCRREAEGAGRLPAGGGHREPHAEARAGPGVSSAAWSRVKFLVQSRLRDRTT